MTLRYSKLSQCTREKIQQANTNSIALVGMPGCGKSTIGRLAAESLGYEFIDSDDVIEKSVGNSITDIFKYQGEVAFRKYEYEYIENIISSANKPYILSTGGGAMMTQRVRKLLLEKTYLIFLEKNLETLWSHIGESHENRPLLNDSEDHPKQKLKKLLQKRTPIYRTAHSILCCDDMNIEDTTNRLIEIIKRNE